MWFGCYNAQYSKSGGNDIRMGIYGMMASSMPYRGFIVNSEI